MGRPKKGEAPKTKSGQRSPTAHRTLEQMRKHGRTYQATPERRKYQRNQNKLSREMGSVGDGKDVSHKKPHSKGGAQTKSNMTLKSPSKNRGHGMSPGGTKPRRRVKGR